MTHCYHSTCQSMFCTPSTFVFPSMVANSDVDCIVQLEPGFSYEKKPHHLTPLKRNVIPYPVSYPLIIIDKLQENCREFFHKSTIDQHILSLFASPLCSAQVLYRDKISSLGYRVEAP